MNRVKVLLVIFIVFLWIESLCGEPTVYIEHLTKIRKANGYLFKISYHTRNEWTDGIMFKLSCVFNKGAELSFTSSGYNNIRRGWHMAEVFVPKVYRDRYGYIQDYRVEMYHKGILVSIKSM